MEITELTVERERFGGCKHDRLSINRHSVRVYEYNGRKYTLDRTLDSLPPFFTLSRHPASGYGLSTTIRVGDHVFSPADHWGDGWTWKRAVAAAMQVIRKES